MDRYRVWLCGENDGKWTRVAKEGSLQICNQWVRQANNRGMKGIAVAWPVDAVIQPDDLQLTPDAIAAAEDREEEAAA